MQCKPITLTVLAFLALPSAYGFAQDRVAPLEVRTEAPRAAAETTPAATRSTSSPPDLLIGAGDLLEVSLYGMQDFKTDVRVNSGGEISLPMLGTVAVSGLSVEQAEALIAHKLTEKGLLMIRTSRFSKRSTRRKGSRCWARYRSPGFIPVC